MKAGNALCYGDNLDTLRRYIDEQVRVSVEGAYRQSVSLLEQNLDKLHRLPGTLLKREVLEGHEMIRLLPGEKLAPMKRVSAEPEPPVGSRVRKCADQAGAWQPRRGDGSGPPGPRT